MIQAYTGKTPRAARKIKTTFDNMRSVVNELERLAKISQVGDDVEVEFAPGIDIVCQVERIPMAGAKREVSDESMVTVQACEALLSREL